MRFYYNHYGSESDSGESAGFAFFTSKAAALRDAKTNVLHLDNPGLSLARPIDVEPTKQGILRALNHWAGHPDNG